MADGDPGDPAHGQQPGQLLRLLLLQLGSDENCHGRGAISSRQTFLVSIFIRA